MSNPFNPHDAAILLNLVTREASHHIDEAATNVDPGAQAMLDGEAAFWEKLNCRVALLLVTPCGPVESCIDPTAEDLTYTRQ